MARKLGWKGSRQAPGVGMFALATLLPLALLVPGALLGGWVAWGALAVITLALLALDKLLAPAADAAEAAVFATADRLSLALGLAHFAALALAVWAVSGGSGLDAGSRVAVFVGFGLFLGQVSNANAHELIHRSERGRFVLGLLVYVSLLIGHHTSAHRLVHHRFAATDDDPATARQGEGFWQFARRAWLDGFRAGYEMEQQYAQRLRNLGRRRGPHPYAVYLSGAAGCLALVIWAAGWRGLLAYLLLAGFAQLQLLASDYVQHYGLCRLAGPKGRPVPIGPAHSWDAPHPASSLWMLNAPRHSDHHAHPRRRYPNLRLGDTTVPGRPMLPHSLPAMAALALIPPLWRRVMDRRLRSLQQAQAAVG